MISQQSAHFDLQYDETISQKAKIGNNSGYLDQEFQLTKQFPNIHQYHFRIQDQIQILKIDKIIKQSKPMQIGDRFGEVGSDQFRNKMNLLLKGIDQNQVKFSNHFKRETHGFYKLEDHYDDDKAFESILQRVKTDSAIKQIQGLSLISVKQYKQSQKRQKKEPSLKIRQEAKQLKALNKKFNRITITEEDL